MKTLRLDQLAGMRIKAARPLNLRELRIEGNGAYSGCVLELDSDDAIVIVSKALGDDADDCWIEARWQTMDGGSLDLTS